MHPFQAPFKPSAAGPEDLLPGLQGCRVSSTSHGKPVEMLDDAGYCDSVIGSPRHLDFSTPSTPSTPAKSIPFSHGLSQTRTKREPFPHVHTTLNHLHIRSHSSPTRATTPSLLALRAVSCAHPSLLAHLRSGSAPKDTEKGIVTYQGYHCILFLTPTAAQTKSHHPRPSSSSSLSFHPLQSNL